MLKEEWAGNIIPPAYDDMDTAMREEFLLTRGTV